MKRVSVVTLTALFTTMLVRGTSPLGWAIPSPVMDDSPLKQRDPREISPRDESPGVSHGFQRGSMKKDPRGYAETWIAQQCTMR
jgi:hypothetical protein